MTGEIIRPERMAQIYWDRARSTCFAEVTGLIRYYESSYKTRAYWRSVLHALEKKAERG